MYTATVQFDNARELNEWLLDRGCWLVSRKSKGDAQWRQRDEGNVAEGGRQSQPRKENDWRKFVLFRPSPRRRYYPGPGERVKHFSQGTLPAMPTSGSASPCPSYGTSPLHRSMQLTAPPGWLSGRQSNRSKQHAPRLRSGERRRGRGRCT